MSRNTHVSVEDADFMFENKPVRVVANRNEAKIELAGLDVGPFEEGKAYEVRFWIAEQLERAGIVRFRDEDVLNVVKLHKIHWKERVQPTNRVSPLSEGFYPKLRRCLAYLERAGKNNPEKSKEHEKSIRISRDIVSRRIRKIVSLASSPPVTAQALEGLTLEERVLYHRLHQIIYNWKKKIFEGENSDGRS